MTNDLTPNPCPPLGAGGVGDRVSLVAIDADDTLWDCQTHFDRAQRELARLLAPYATADDVERELDRTERRRVPLTGYGANAFTLSMVETAVSVTRGRATAQEIDRVLALGRDLLRVPADPLPGVRDTLERLRRQRRWTVVAFTKGDPLDQNRKLDRSRLRPLFDDVAVVADKTEESYLRLCRRVGVAPERLLMVGDSMRSDILPALAVGGWAVHVPARSSWAHEHAPSLRHDRLWRLDRFSDLL